MTRPSRIMVATAAARATIFVAVVIAISIMVLIPPTAHSWVPGNSITQRPNPSIKHGNFLFAVAITVAITVTILGYNEIVTRYAFYCSKGSHVKVFGIHWRILRRGELASEIPGRDCLGRLVGRNQNPTPGDGEWHAATNSIHRGDPTKMGRSLGGAAMAHPKIGRHVDNDHRRSGGQTTRKYGPTSECDEMDQRNGKKP